MNQVEVLNSKFKLKSIDIGTIMEGIIINKKRDEIYIDLSPYGTGRVYGIFYLQCKNLSQKVNVGDKVGVKIVELDDGQGNYVVVLQELTEIDKWQQILNYYHNNTILDLEIKDVNRGGCLVEINGITGFIPVSQLSPEYYPRVENNNKALIYEHLKKLIGTKIKARIISADYKNNKLVLSEKASKENIYKEILNKLIINDILKVKIVGISNFGLFVRFNENPPMDGLVHISEIPNDKLELDKNFKIGDEINAKLIKITKDKVSFSLKDLTPDPWVKFAKNHKVGDIVEGVVKEKNNIFGLIVVDGIQGLTFDNLNDIECEKKYRFIIEKLEINEKNLILKLATQ